MRTQMTRSIRQIDKDPDEGGMRGLVGGVEAPVRMMRVDGFRLWEDSYGALRHRELSLEEDQVYNTFKVGQGSGSAQDSKRPERVSAFKQPTLTTWIDPKDGMVYIDFLTYPPLPPIQTPPSPQWTSGSLPISPSPFVVPSPISSPMIPLTVPYPVATPSTTETKEFLTELGSQVKMQWGGGIRMRLFSPEEYGFRSLEYEQERVAVTFRAICTEISSVACHQ
ncbi:hypothetical protein Tco_1548022 [Tanacetum coccineum]